MNFLNSYLVLILRNYQVHKEKVWARGPWEKWSQQQHERDSSGRAQTVPRVWTGTQENNFRASERDTWCWRAVHQTKLVILRRSGWVNSPEEHCFLWSRRSSLCSGNLIYKVKLQRIVQVNISFIFIWDSKIKFRALRQSDYKNVTWLHEADYVECWILTRLTSSMFPGI